ncbi:hypothetical protein TRICI_001154 [Trichomonascus ciferrii]|uniref:Uncharacterized protein n=1 Tax=Trichomonascus ciferrii TaxID=44093 RepID=A0A642VBF7_9ASCO|nr:hypothetical protein TRICI_001154 [Trichomonascus ciferrii]
MIRLTVTVNVSPTVKLMIELFHRIPASEKLQPFVHRFLSEERKYVQSNRELSPFASFKNNAASQQPCVVLRLHTRLVRPPDPAPHKVFVSPSYDPYSVRPLYFYCTFMKLSASITIFSFQKKQKALCGRPDHPCQGEADPTFKVSF